MLDFLAKKFIKNHNNIDNRSVRIAYGYLGGFVVILGNVLLFVVKFMIGFFSHSVAIMADAFNNLSDAGSGIAMLLGFYFSGKPADKEHPFGHGRGEYISALFISFMVILVGIQFVKTSIERIIHPTQVQFHIALLIVLMLSILFKVWLAYFNYKLGKKINSDALTAAALDSISDVVTTSVVTVSLFVGNTIEMPIDGYIGLLVSAFIIIGGIKLIRETMTPILGEASNLELTKKLEYAILQCDERIIGMHDMIIHDYGPGRLFVTVDVELPDDLSLIEAHQIADRIERRVSNQYQIDLFVHMDPISKNNPAYVEVRDFLTNFFEKEEQGISFHDLQLIEKNGKKILSFDLIVPIEYEKEQTWEVIKKLKQEMKNKNMTFATKIKIDREGIHTGMH